VTLAESKRSAARSASGTIPGTQCQGHSSRFIASRFTNNALVTLAENEHSETRSVSGSETQITQVQRSEICKAELSNSQSLLGTIPEAQRSGKSSVLFAPARKGDVRHSLADISLARELLGYEVGVDFKEGIRRTVEWYLKL